MLADGTGDAANPSEKQKTGIHRAFEDLKPLSETIDLLPVLPRFGLVWFGLAEIALGPSLDGARIFENHDSGIAPLMFPLARSTHESKVKNVEGESGGFQSLSPL
ncbi:MAG: hypothetical protein ACJAVK_000405 [Akkermansiaceae bacterium]|jgi:hypothetical protein